jgi:predicted transcriptional regulator
MKHLDLILGLLRDSHWHSVESIKKEISLPTEKLNKIISLLQEFGFTDKEDNMIRISRLGLKFLELPS